MASHEFAYLSRSTWRDDPVAMTKELAAAEKALLDLNRAINNLHKLGVYVSLRVSSSAPSEVTVLSKLVT